MSNTTIFVGNFEWPVGDHPYITAESLQLLDFLRIEASSLAATSHLGRLDIDIDELARWNVVRGWGPKNYSDALVELWVFKLIGGEDGASQPRRSVIINIDPPDTHVPEPQKHQPALVVELDEAQLETVLLQE